MQFVYKWHNRGRGYENNKAEADEAHRIRVSLEYHKSYEIVAERDEHIAHKRGVCRGAVSVQRDEDKVKYDIEQRAEHRDRENEACLFVDKLDVREYKVEGREEYSEHQHGNDRQSGEILLAAENIYSLGSHKHKQDRKDYSDKYQRLGLFGELVVVLVSYQLVSRRRVRAV